MKFVKIVTIFLSVISLILLFIFLWWHWELGLVRYFDVDEFAYMHWAYQVFSGQKPYIDFFLYVPPGFQWFMAPLFAFGKGVFPLIAGRMVSFGIFAGLVASTIYLFWLVRKSWIAVIAGMLLAFLPLPFDKFLEIRPDNLSALLVMLGIIEQIHWMRNKRSGDVMLAGIFYALSLIILPKSVPAIGIAFLVGVAYVLTKKKLKIAVPALSGFLLPTILFGVWTITLGNLPLVIYSIFCQMR